MNDKEYFDWVEKQVEENSNSKILFDSAKNWHDESRKNKYQYLFNWLGRPIIQDPQDIVNVQELIWRCKPDLVIETGIARGGSLILSASILALFDHFEVVKNKRKVIGIDIDIREHTRKGISNHPLANSIELLEGSSINDKIVANVCNRAKNFEKVMVFLDSYHTCDHVYNELLSYAPLVSIGSYCLVFDTGIEDVPVEDIGEREWGPGNSPKTAVDKFIRHQEDDSISYKFQIDEFYQNRSIITSARSGFLKRIS